MNNFRHFEDKPKEEVLIPKNKNIHQDHIYFNVDFTLPPEAGIKGPMKYSARFGQPILSVGQNYHLAVARFSIPLYDVPLVYFRIEEGFGQTDPDLGVYKMTLRYGGVDYTNNVMYRSLNNPAIPTPLPPSQNFGEQVDSVYYNIYFPENFIYMFNQCLAQCTADLLAAVPALAPLNSPYLQWDNVNQFINLIAPRKFETEGIQLFFNVDTFHYLSSFTSDYTRQGDDFYEILIESKPNFDNGYTLYGTVPSTPPEWIIIEPNWSQFQYWAEIKSVVLKTTLLPIRTEVSTVNNGTNIIGDPILTDFLVTDYDGSAETIEFIAQGFYRFIDIVTQNEIDAIDIEIFWKDTQNVLRPFTQYITSNKAASVKLAFIKENLPN